MPLDHRPARASARTVRRACAWLCVLVVSLGALACSEPRGLVILDPQDPGYVNSVQLGKVQFGDVLEHVVRLRNEEGRDVTVRDVSAGCSCTSARLSYLDAHGARVEASSLLKEKPFVVPARAVLEVKLRVESKVVPTFNSPKLVIVRIHSDSEVDPALTLELHMFVEMPFVVAPRSINLGQVAIGAIAQGRTDISPALDTGERITGVLAKPDNMEVALETPEQIGFNAWRLNVRWFPPLERGAQLRSVVLSTTGPGGAGEGRPLEIQVQAVGVENVITEPALFSLPATLEPNSGAGAVVLRSLVPGNRLRVTGARAEGPFASAFTVAATPEQPDDAGRSERWVVQLTCVEPPRSEGAFAGHVVVALDDPVTPEVRIPYQRKAP